MTYLPKISIKSSVIKGENNIFNGDKANTGDASADAKVLNKIKSAAIGKGTYGSVFQSKLTKYIYKSILLDSTIYSITPKMNCKKCGESTISKVGDVQQIQTKYPEGYQI